MQPNDLLHTHDETKMTDAHNFPSMDIDLLAQECAESKQKFYRRVAYEAGYCFELLCRAYRDRVDAALNHVYRIYVPMLAAKARRHPAYPRTCQDANLFARIALANFYQAVNGEKFLQKFSVLAAVIQYMYVCVATAVGQDAQDFPPEDSPPEESLPSPTPSSASELNELWSHICRVLVDETDQRLAYLRFVLEMKPAEIAKHYPELWKTPRDVSVALQTIRRRLRADPYLRGLAGFSDDEPVEDAEEDDTKNDENE